MTAEDLRHQFHNEQGISWENSQGEPDIDYVIWLEQKVIRLKSVEAKMPSEEEALQYFNNHFDCYTDVEIDNYTTTEIAMTRSAILKMVEWFRNRIKGGEKNESK
jgi:hypothetical protein